jgi:hypothetical protein
MKVFLLCFSSSSFDRPYVHHSWYENTVFDLGLVTAGLRAHSNAIFGEISSRKINNKGKSK